MKEFFILINENRYYSAMLESVDHVRALLELHDINLEDVVVIEASEGAREMLGNRSFIPLHLHK